MYHTKYIQVHETLKIIFGEQLHKVWSRNKEVIVENCDLPERKHIEKQKT